MKQIFCLVMAVALVCGTLLTGCGRYSDADPTDTTTETERLAYAVNNSIADSQVRNLHVLAAV